MAFAGNARSSSLDAELCVASPISKSTAVGGNWLVASVDFSSLLVAIVVRQAVSDQNVETFAKVDCAGVGHLLILCWCRASAAGVVLVQGVYWCCASAKHLLLILCTSF
ncbi:hypothetical protein Ancab_008890 [Ancistrocladus abbreviatus]